MKFFTLYWLHGKREFLFGTNIEEAFRKADKTAALNASSVDFYKEGFDFSHIWNKQTRTWDCLSNPPHEINAFDFCVNGRRLQKALVQQTSAVLQDQGIVINTLDEDRFMVSPEHLQIVWRHCYS